MGNPRFTLGNISLETLDRGRAVVIYLEYKVEN